MQREIHETEVVLISCLSDGRNATSLHKVLTMELEKWTSNNNQKKDFQILSTVPHSSITKRKKAHLTEEPFFLCLSISIVYSYTRIDYVHNRSESKKTESESGGKEVESTNTESKKES